MKTILIIFSSSLSLMSLYVNHPLVLGFILLTQTISVSLITGMMSQTFWFSYILFLIFVGGMLVLFIYMASLASNEMISFSSKIMSMLLLTMIIISMMMKNIQNSLYLQDSSIFMDMNISVTDQLMKFYNKPTHMITIMLGSYLFLSLIAVVKITNISMGPLRQMN
uniref:NADH dehydrogenase subunit 6 n=1 Tax=Margattea concava TaxID=1928781 RepID=UPI0027A32282|nr:NADH dehydrogenase subunit 6 [Margattea concava]WGO57298.1 NADH dehydrogenase subunit 6 [Margattea concava]